jgi:hypothetical protein
MRRARHTSPLTIIPLRILPRLLLRIYRDGPSDSARCTNRSLPSTYPVSIEPLPTITAAVVYSTLQYVILSDCFSSAVSRWIVSLKIIPCPSSWRINTKPPFWTRKHELFHSFVFLKLSSRLGKGVSIPAHVSSDDSTLTSIHYTVTINVQPQMQLQEDITVSFLHR